MSTELITGLARAHPAWLRFVKAMEGRQYSAHDTEKAWYWFQRGWDVHAVAVAPTPAGFSFPLSHD